MLTFFSTHPTTHKDEISSSFPTWQFGNEEQSDLQELANTGIGVGTQRSLPPFASFPHTKRELIAHFHPLSSSHTQRLFSFTFKLTPSSSRPF